jgi:hypothetical protein
VRLCRHLQHERMLRCGCRRRGWWHVAPSRVPLEGCHSCLLFGLHAAGRTVARASKLATKHSELWRCSAVQTALDQSRELESTQIGAMIDLTARWRCTAKKAAPREGGDVKALTSKHH